MTDAPRHDEAPASGGDDGETPSKAPKASGTSPGSASVPIAAVWVVLCLVIAVALWRGGGPEISGDLEGLIPHAHRARPGEPLVLLQIAEVGLAPDGSPEEALLTAAQRIGDRMASQRVPLAPPATELTAWLDAYALYLLPVSAHETLAAALSERSMLDHVDSLKARLSSPMFGVSGEQPRRDPLGLTHLTDDAASQLGRLSDPGAMGARPTATGDLLADDGQALLIGLQTERALPALRREVGDAISDLPVRATLVGAAAERERAVQTINSRGPRLFALALAAITGVLAIALRNVRAVVAMVACIASAIAGFVWLSPPVGILALPLVVLLAGFGCEGAVQLQRISERISERAWPAAAVLATALVPLWLSPYPQWRAWSWRWAVGVVAVALVVRIALPAITSLIGHATPRPQGGLGPRPMRLLALTLAMAALGAGAWSVGQLGFLGFDRQLLGESDPAVRLVQERFFDSRRLVETRTVGRDPADAMARAASDSRALAQLVPEHASRIDSPGSFVLPVPELEQRRHALSGLKLAERMDVLFELLSSRGFQPDAFGEFLRGASDLRNMPTPQAALDGPLGPWIARYLEEDGDTVVLRSLVHLRDATGPVPEISRGDSGPPLRLHGPAVGSRIDRTSFANWLGIYVALQLWLGALLVWLGTRSLAISVGATVAALTAQSALLAAMRPLGLALGPQIIPALLLVGAAGMVAGARACRAIDLQRPFLAKGLLVTGLCQAAAGLALVATGEPAWARVGMMIAVGTLAGSTAGLLVAPGIARLLRPSFGRHDAVERDRDEQPQGAP